MPWFMVDDKLHSHRKAVRAGVPAMGLWALAGSWSADHLTDGFIPDFIAQRIDADAALHATELVRAGLWTEAEKGDETGWQFHEWDSFQPTKEAVEEKRAAARERMARVRGNRKEGSQEVRANSERTSQEVRLTPALPSPSQPVETGARKRGTRIPEGFAVDDEMRRWATDSGLGHLDLQAITVEFVDYWVGVAGAKGVKLDWVATWRNWIRRKAQDAPRNVRPIRAAGLPEGW
jgi:hypothetical protein